MECIQEAFGIDLNDNTDQATYSMKPGNLMSIFNVFVNTQKKVKVI